MCQTLNITPVQSSTVQYSTVNTTYRVPCKVHYSNFEIPFAQRFTSGKFCILKQLGTINVQILMKISFCHDRAMLYTRAGQTKVKLGFFLLWCIKMPSSAPHNGHVKYGLMVGINELEPSKPVGVNPSYSLCTCPFCPSPIRLNIKIGPFSGKEEGPSCV